MKDDIDNIILLLEKIVRDFDDNKRFYHRNCVSDYLIDEARELLEVLR